MLQTPTAINLPAATSLPATETPDLPTATMLPSTTEQPASTPTLTATPPPQASGADQYPANINPLTGLPVPDASMLALAPGLVSISNSPVTARPQAGLSYASQVYEFYLGEGASRFLAVFYGNLPPAQTEDKKEVEVGPIRSGRLPYETLRQFYNGFLVFASASEQVLEHLDQYQIIQNKNIEDINGASIPVTRLQELGQSTANDLGKPALSGLRFDPAVHSGGKTAKKIWMAYHYYDQVFWQYDDRLQAYTRWQDDGEGTPLRQAVDRMNNKPLAFQNVVVMFANYVRYSETFFDITLKYITRYPALLFRDGQMYEIYWTTSNGDYERTTGKLRPPRFIQYNGSPVALKPGQTWIEIVQLHNTYYETVDSLDYNHLRAGNQPGSGVWAVFFMPPEYEPTEEP